MLRRTPVEESELTLAVRELRDELGVLRDVLSELTEAAQWQNNNAEEYPALVRDRSTLWTLVEARLPRLIDALTLGPDAPLPPSADREPRRQRDLF